MALQLLLVEDDGVLFWDMESQIAGLGHTVVGGASSAQQAVEAARRLRPDLVLMDIRLEGQGDGITAARRIRDELGIPSLFVSGRLDPETTARACSAHPLGFLRKPFAPAELARALRLAEHAQSGPQLDLFHELARRQRGRPGSTLADRDSGLA
jgi:CheY-like chemotaxis protein